MDQYLVPSYTAAAVAEIRSAGVAFPEKNDLAIVANFADTLPQFLREGWMEQAKSDLDFFLERVLASVGVQWRKIEKRTPLHTAVLFVFFRVVQKCFLVGRFAARASFARTFPDLIARQDCGQLMHFANCLCVMSQFIRPKNNKQVFILVAGSLESGCRRRYVTGGAATEDTRLRVDIFHRMFDVRKTSRTAKRQLADAIVEPASLDFDHSAHAWSPTPSSESDAHLADDALFWQTSAVHSPFETSSESESEQDPPAKRTRVVADCDALDFTVLDLAELDELLQGFDTPLESI